MRKFIQILLLSFGIMSALCAQAQTVAVSGKVVDTAGEPLPGVTVLIKGTTSGAVTNIDGDYTLPNVPTAGTLQFSFVGMLTQEIQVSGQTTIDVTMQADAIGIEEVVAVGYGTQKKASLTSAVGAIKGESFRETPVTSTSNALAGRLSGVIAQQTSGEPGSDATTIRIRGIGTMGNAAPLVVVDGIERPMNTVNPNDIESVTVLKDAASVAPYGMRGANGVIVITTRRGSEGKFSVSYDGKVGVQTPINLHKEVDSWEYGRYRNEALANEGVEAQYTAEQIEMFKNGTDLNRYPNAHVAEDYMDPALLHQHHLSVTGGTKKLSFFGSLGYLDQESNFGRAINFQRYTLKSNVDFRPTDLTSISLDYAATYEDAQRTPMSTYDIFVMMMRLNPTWPLFYENGLPGAYQNDRNPYMMIHENGYRRSDDYLNQLSLKLDQKIPFVSGLTFKGNLSIDKSDNADKVWQTPYTIYSLNQNDEYIPLQGGDVASPQLTQSHYSWRKITSQLMLDYQRSWGDHAFSALGVFESSVSQSTNLWGKRLAYDLLIDELSMGSSNPADIDNGGTSGEAKQAGYAYRLTYGYKGKYLVEASGRYDGHYYFAPGSRFAFFPSLSAAWRVSEESFMDGAEAIDNLKLRFSWGKSGNLAGGPFQYLSQYNTRPSNYGYFWRNGTYLIGGVPILSIYETLDPNTSITWEKAQKYDFGFDINLFSGLLNVEADVFYEKREDMLLPSDDELPAEYGIAIGQENIGVMDNRGVDFKISSFKQFNDDWSVEAAFNFTYAKNKVIELIETETVKNDPERSRTGKPLGTRFGLKKLGYFTSQEEIDNTPWAQGMNLQPGDVKYWDRNEDGTLNSLDNVVIGNPGMPGIIYGFDVAVKRKNMDFNMFWQGAGITDMYYSGWSRTPFYQGDATMFEHHKDYWTPDNQDAEWGRLEPSPSSNTLRTSDHWIRSGAYLRLKSASLGYTMNFPEWGIQKMRVYLSGQNLLTISAQDYIDPEGNMSLFPQQRVVSLGLQLNF